MKHAVYSTLTNGQGPQNVDNDIRVIVYDYHNCNCVAADLCVSRLENQDNNEFMSGGTVTAYNNQSVVSAAIKIL